jgi:hypothetical protein
MFNAIKRRQELRAEELANHVFSTYASIRYGMAAIAAAFPLVLAIGGWIKSGSLQTSMSAYYWATTASEYPPMRIWFVGILFVVGAFLYLYKGFTPLENYALNVAGVCAFGVALVPMPWNCQPCSPFSLHGTCAVVLFLCVAYVSLWRAKDTLRLVDAEALKRKYRRGYRTLGVLMVLSPLTALVTTTLLTGGLANYVLFIEAAGIYAFAAYWWVKSRELARTNAEEHAIGHRLRTSSQGVQRVGATTLPGQGR